MMLVRSLKEELGGHHFDDGDGVETFVRNRLQTRPDSFNNFRFGGKTCEKGEII